MSDERDRPANEIEITPEMIKAGEEIVLLRWGDLTAPDRSTLFVETVIEILTAALQAQSRPFSICPETLAVFGLRSNKNPQADRPFLPQLSL
jgi:hypothetical protein